MSSSTLRTAKPSARLIPTSTHWGNFLIEKDGDRMIAVHSYDADSNPSPIGQSLLDAQDAACRIPCPMIRQGYLKKTGDGAGRGTEPFVAVPWDEAMDIAAEAILRVRQQYGNQAIFGGSYGWASAGRFHHSQSQLHRFLNCIGGYVSSVQSYSTGAAQIILPHVFGVGSHRLMTEAPTMEDVIKHTKLVVSFGGISMKNTQINQGGIGNHSARAQLQAARSAGVQFVNISPVRDDVADFLDADWWPCRPNSDVALMLGLAHTLISENLHDQLFLQRYCLGFERFAEYLLGQHDGQPKTAEWAETLCDINAVRIRALARKMAAEPCLLSISWSLQRTEHGEQPYWMIATLAAMLGEIGLPGRGVGFGYGCIHNFGFAGRKTLSFKAGALPQGKNPIKAFIPVARIADALLHPGEAYTFNGETCKYPEIQLIHWAGGNPFHHHQDLNRLRQAWARPDAVIVHDCVWTATARHADIVFPATTALERNDFSCGGDDLYFAPMHQVTEPFAEARNDYAALSGLAERLGCGAAFTEGRSAQQWIEYLWQITRQRAAESNIDLPDFDTFWQQGQYAVDPAQLPERTFVLEQFRTNPDKNPLGTPSGRIEIYSKRIASFAYDDCKGHPMWLDKQEFLGSPRAREYPLALVSNQPRTRLHSQYDHGRTSRKSKTQQRETARMHPDDAATRGIQDGDVVRIFNDRGACLAGIKLTDRIRTGAIELPTGAWYDPQDPAQNQSLEVHGNPNVLTRDAGTSKLGQATSAHSCLVEVERYDQPLPDIKVFGQPISLLPS